MKSKSQVAALAVVLFAGFGVAQAESPYPADAEASVSLPALDTYADQQARNGSGADSQWGVGKRQSPTPHEPFPFGGGYQDD
jgi:hypothetical protein